MVMPANEAASNINNRLEADRPSGLQQYPCWQSDYHADSRSIEMTGAGCANQRAGEAQVLEMKRRASKRYSLPGCVIQECRCDDGARANTGQRDDADRNDGCDPDLIILGCGTRLGRGRGRRRRRGWRKRTVLERYGHSRGGRAGGGRFGCGRGGLDQPVRGLAGAGFFLGLLERRLQPALSGCSRSMRRVA